MKSLVNVGETSVLQGFSRALRLFKRKPFKKTGSFSVHMQHEIMLF